tara:strand:- start:550 stop:669 length:120 start_codon:yes stop_codon:yes gene_type:complete
MGAARTQVERSSVLRRETESMMGGGVQLDFLEMLDENER